MSVFAHKFTWCFTQNFEYENPPYVLMFYLSSRCNWVSGFNTISKHSFFDRKWISLVVRVYIFSLFSWVFRRQAPRALPLALHPRSRDLLVISCVGFYWGRSKSVISWNVRKDASSALTVYLWIFSPTLMDGLCASWTAGARKMVSASSLYSTELENIMVWR